MWDGPIAIDVRECPGGRVLSDAEALRTLLPWIDLTDLAEGLQRLGPGHHETENVVYRLGMTVLDALNPEGTP
jgi:hypothetical protein